MSRVSLKEEDRKDCLSDDDEKVDQEKTKKEIKARGGPPGYPDKSRSQERKM